MSERCQWEGCTNAALPNLPPGQGVCAQHIAAATEQLDRFTADLNRRMETKQPILDGPTLPLWRKPGRWVPWILFVVWLVLTAYYGNPMVFWWFVFMPIAWLGWQFGTNNTGKGPYESRGQR